MSIFRVGLIVALVASGCAEDPYGSSVMATYSTDRCEISGAGSLASGDIGDGAVTGDDTGASGTWVHTTAAGSVIVATPTFTLCRFNGRTLGDFGATGSIDGVPGYLVRVSIVDRTPGAPEIVEGTPTTETLVASVLYRPTRFVDATLPITEDAARVTIPAELPVTVGDPGTGHAVLSFTRADTLDTINCQYRGDGRSARGGTTYLFEQCNGRHGMPRVEAGDVVDVTWLGLRVQSGSRCSGVDETTVSLELTGVVPLIIGEPRPDDYTMWVQDSLGAEVYRAEGGLASGDFTVTPL